MDCILCHVSVRTNCHTRARINLGVVKETSMRSEILFRGYKEDGDAVMDDVVDDVMDDVDNVVDVVVSLKQINKSRTELTITHIEQVKALLSKSKISIIDETNVDSIIVDRSIFYMRAWMRENSFHQTNVEDEYHWRPT